MRNSSMAPFDGVFPIGHVGSVFVGAQAVGIFLRYKPN
jgi:hypothetical protein